jgi:hypothetical protein
VDPRAGLDDLEKRKFLILLGIELRLLAPAVNALKTELRGTVASDVPTK